MTDWAIEHAVRAGHIPELAAARAHKEFLAGKAAYERGDFVAMRWAVGREAYWKGRCPQPDIGITCLADEGPRFIHVGQRVLRPIKGPSQ